MLAKTKKICIIYNAKVEMNPKSSKLEDFKVQKI